MCERVFEENGSFRLSSESRPLYPRMPRREFVAGHFWWWLRRSRMKGLNGSQLVTYICPHCILAGVRFELWIVFEDDLLKRLVLFHPLHEPPQSWFGRLRCCWRKFSGSHGKLMTAEEEQAWIKHRKSVHDQWLDTVLPDHKRVGWGLAESRQEGGPIWPQIMIEYD